MLRGKEEWEGRDSSSEGGSRDKGKLSSNRGREGRGSASSTMKGKMSFSFNDHDDSDRKPPS